MISLKEVLTEMERRRLDNPFSITFVKKSNGALVTLDKVVLAKFMNEREKKESKQSVSQTRTTNHWEDSTRLLFIPSSGQKRECKIRLITRFNGHQVYY